MSTEFTPGDFRSFRATNKIHLGEIQKDVPQGTIVQFDGQTLKWGQGEYSVPQLVAGIRAGWLVPAEDTETQYVPQPAGVRVRPATSAGEKRGEEMKMEEASEEETVVGNLDAANTRRDEARAKELAANRPAAPKPSAVVQPPSQPDPQPEKGEPQPAATSGQTMEVVSDDQSNDDAVAVASIKTAAKSKTVIDDAAAASRAIKSLDNKPPPRATQLTDIRETKEGTTGDVTHAMAGSELEEVLPDAASSGKPDHGVMLVDGTVWPPPEAHWRTRVSMVAKEYADKPEAARQILAIEKETVARHMRSALAKKGVKL